ncbi:MAG: lipopolysaccharide biosynthesis protein [Prevotella sp.]|nr:lipopolysaccharide biosynthesis protein [Prevotella sp.]
MGETLKEKTSKGLFWSSVNNGTTQVLNLLFGIFLARRLTAADYGILAVIAVFTLIAGCIQAAGFSQALANKKDASHRDYNAVFWFNTLAGFFLYALLFCCAPLLALFFHQPVLVDVSRFTFLAIPISALGIIPNAYLWIHLRTKELAVANFVALVISGSIGLWMAYHDYAYWSLACQQVSYILVADVMKYYFTRWYPTLPVDFRPIRSMFRFSVKVLATNILTTVNQNVLTFIFARLFPITAVGIYNQANKWNTMGHTLITNTMNQVAQPVLAAVNDDKERELRVFRKMIRFTAFLAFPIMLGLATVAHEFIILTITEKWAASIPLLQILCVGGSFMPFYTLYQNMAISNGRSDIYLHCSVIQILIQLAIIVVFYRWGITTMVIAYSVSNALFLFVWHLFTHELCGIRLRQLLSDIMPFALIALTSMVATYCLTMQIKPLLALLATRVVVAGCLYVAALKLLHAEILDECLQYVMDKYKRNKH